MNWFNKLRAAQHVHGSPYKAALLALPPGLQTYWRYSAPGEFKGIRTDAFFFACAAEGLMNFFAAVRRSGKACALPSQAADSVWHAWLRWHPDGLERFCIQHFGGTVPHVERPGLGTGALINTFVSCRQLEDLVSRKMRGPRLPALFRLDAALRMPDGHGYWHHLDEIIHARLGPRGVCLVRALPHPELTPHALFAAGLVIQHAPAAWLQRRCAAKDSGSAASSCGCNGLADGGCGEGGGDAGSSCGSSCGGGCGGGD